MPDICKHDVLARSCSRCDDERRIAELEADNESLRTRLRQLCDAMEERAALLDGRSVEGRNLHAAVKSAREALKP